MTMALTRANWHKAYALPFPNPARTQSSLAAQWKCDTNGVPRCHWVLLPTPCAMAHDFRAERPSPLLELIR